MFVYFFFFFKYFIFVNIFYFLFLLLFIVAGGVLSFLERKYLSLIQRRIGPNYAGYKGRLQFIADALKVFFKEFIYLNKTNFFFYFFFPILYFIINLFLIFIVFYKNIVFSNNLNYIIYFYIISTYSTILLFFVSYFSKNKYSNLSAFRILIFIFSIDFFFVLFLNIIIFYTKSFSVFSYNTTKYLNFYLNIWFNIFFYLIVFLIHINKAPFDLYEAESELVAGYFIEYSGFMFGLFVLVEYFHLYFFSFFLCFLLF